MPFRRIPVPSLGRSLSNVVAGLSSAEPESHEPGLNSFRRLGGNCLHVHGEGGEIHSRTALGRWLHKHNARPEMFICAQVCHEGWNSAAEKPVDRFTPEALREDIAADLDLLKTGYLDLTYVANVSDAGIAPFIDAMAEEVLRGRVRAYGVRNWTEAQLRQAASYAQRLNLPGPSAVVTTELALPVAAQPLWPEDIPFVQIEPAVHDLSLVVFAHADAFNQGHGLFGTQSIQPRWHRRWDRQANAPLIRRLNEAASTRGVIPEQMILEWLLNQPFPSLAVVSIPDLLASPGIYEAASTLKAE